MEINYGKTATVKGKVILDDGSGTDKAGTNIKVYAEINYSDLVAQDSAAQGVKTFKTITDAEGEYQFELPVTDNGTNVSIYTETVEVQNGYYASGYEDANGCKPNIIKYVADITLTLTKTTTDNSSNTGN